MLEQTGRKTWEATIRRSMAENRNRNMKAREAERGRNSEVTRKNSKDNVDCGCEGAAECCVGLLCLFLYLIVRGEFSRVSGLVDVLGDMIFRS